MLRDLEGHEIRIVSKENGHILVYGNSGQGKTFFLCRMIEEAYERGEKVLIIDFSGSYSEKQLQEKGFLYTEEIRRYNIREKPLLWGYRVNGQDLFHDDIVDAICQTLGCGSYVQIRVLHDVVDDVLERRGEVSLFNIVNRLEDIIQGEREDEKIPGYVDAVYRLLSRLYPYRIENLRICQGISEAETIMPITIIELTDFPEKQRKFLTEFILSIFWREIYRQKFSNRCDVVLLDEIQFLSLKEGDTLSALLREAQKRHVKVFVSTQFLSAYERKDLLTLEQAEHMVIFRPTPEDYRWSAQKISMGAYREWEKKLSQLQRGQAVLKGHYGVDNRERTTSTPLVIQLI